MEACTERTERKYIPEVIPARTPPYVPPHTEHNPFSHLTATSFNAVRKRKHKQKDSLSLLVSVLAYCMYCTCFIATTANSAAFPPSINPSQGDDNNGPSLTCPPSTRGAKAEATY